MAELEDLRNRIARLEALVATLVMVDLGPVLDEEMIPALDSVLRRTGPKEESLWPYYFASIRKALPIYRETLREVRDRTNEQGAKLEGLESRFEQLREEAISQAQFRLADLEERFQSIGSSLRQVEADAEESRFDVHEYFAVLSLGLPLDAVPLPRFITVRAYLNRGDERSVVAVLGTVELILGTIGFGVSDEFPPELGSWFGRLIGKSKEAITQPEVTRRLEKVERAAELELIQGKQAAADRQQAEAVAALIKALENEKSAAIQVGSILLLKSSDSRGNSQVMVRTLTIAEMVALEKNPNVLHEPSQVLEYLGHCAASPQLADGTNKAPARGDNTPLA